MYIKHFFSPTIISFFLSLHCVCVYILQQIHIGDVQLMSRVRYMSIHKERSLFSFPRLDVMTIIHDDAIQRKKEFVHTQKNHVDLFFCS